MPLTARQARRLRRAYTEIGDVLAGAGVFEQNNSEPKWRAIIGKRWALLSAVAQINGGDVSPVEWALLGREHGYDPRGLGGFFRGREQAMTRHGGRRILTEAGQRFVDRWRDEFDTTH